MSNFGQRLKLLREQNKLTQKQISIMLKVSESTIGKYENNQRTPPPDTITTLADFFNVTTDYLLGRTEHPTTGMLSNEKLKLIEEIEKLSPEGQERIKFAVKLLSDNEQQSNTEKSS